MTVNFDPSADFAKVIDGAEVVTLRRRGLPAAAATVVTHALRQAITVHEAIQSRGRYAADDVIWHLAAAELDSGPQLSDIVVDGGGRWWTIFEVHVGTLAGRWRCVTRDLAAAHRLGDTITILQAFGSKTAGGAAELSWRIWKTGIRAKIQPATIEVKSEHLTERTVTRYRIFVESDLVLDHTHRIQGPDGRLYKILAGSAAQRPGELQIIDAESI